MAAQTSSRKKIDLNQQQELKKPIRPLTAYHLFFQLEREYILQTAKSPDDDVIEREDVRPLGKDLDEEMPSRYQNVHLSPSWYDSASGKRTKTKESEQKRKHRKSHGKITFQCLSRRVASRWATLEETDNETKRYCEKIAKRELGNYKEQMKKYNASLAADEEQNENCALTSVWSFGSASSPSSPAMASNAYLPSSSSAHSICSRIGNMNSGSPGALSVSRSSSTSFELSPYFIPDWTKESNRTLAGSTVEENTGNSMSNFPSGTMTSNTNRSEFSFFPLLPSFHESEGSFLQSSQKRMRHTGPMLSQHCQFLPMSGRPLNGSTNALVTNHSIGSSTKQNIHAELDKRVSCAMERERNESCQFIVMTHPSHAEFDTRLPHAMESEVKESGSAECENAKEPANRKAGKRLESEAWSDDTTPLDYVGDSSAQMEFTTDDVKNLLNALF